VCLPKSKVVSGGREGECVNAMYLTTGDKRIEIPCDEIVETVSSADSVSHV